MEFGDGFTLPRRGVFEKGDAPTVEKATNVNVRGFNVCAIYPYSYGSAPSKTIEHTYFCTGSLEKEDFKIYNLPLDNGHEYNVHCTMDKCTKTSSQPPQNAASE